MTEHDTILLLSRTILPQRLNSIRSLRIEWSFWYPSFMHFSKELCPPYHLTWDKTWQIIAGMSSLKDLRVSLIEHWHSRDAESEAKLLAPLRQVTGLKRFDVAVSWSFYETGASPMLGDIPFRIERDMKVAWVA